MRAPLVVWLGLAVSLVAVRAHLRAQAPAAPTPNPTPATTPAPDVPLAIGAKAGAFTFTDRHWLPRKLDDLGPANAYVLYFATTDCPMVGRSLPRLGALERELRARGVRFAAVNVGAGDSIVDACAQAVEHDVAFPVVKDHDGSVVAALGVTRTATAVVLDADRRLRYRGRVDGQQRLTGATPAPARADLREAIEDVLGGRTVAVPATEVDGCKIGALGAAPATGTRTWHRDVAPLVQRHCQECHRDGGSAPFSLATRRDVVDRAATIAEVVAQQRMPPWHASRKHGAIANARGPSREERDVLLDWLADPRFPEGTPAALPDGAPPAAAVPTVAPASEWRIDPPDLVLHTVAPVRIPAEGVIPYFYVVFTKVFTEDTWVEQIEILPSNKKVLHHANLAHFPQGGDWAQDGFITGFVPGGDTATFAPGTAMLIPKGSRLGLQAHYVSTGKPETDRVRIGLRFPRVAVARRARVMIVADRRFTIPPGEPAVRSVASRKFPRPATGIGMFSHMHTRGRDMTFVEHPPEGDPSTLLLLASYSFDWQAAYRWAEGTKHFAAGTRIEVIAHFDNSRWNAFNPDAAATVRFGLQTTDEMMYGFLYYTFDDEQLALAVDPVSGAAR